MLVFCFGATRLSDSTAPGHGAQAASTRIALHRRNSEGLCAKGVLKLRAGLAPLQPPTNARVSQRAQGSHALLCVCFQAPAGRQRQAEPRRKSQIRGEIADDIVLAELAAMREQGQGTNWHVMGLDHKLDASAQAADERTSIAQLQGGHVPQDDIELAEMVRAHADDDEELKKMQQEIEMLDRMQAELAKDDGNRQELSNPQHAAEHHRPHGQPPAHISPGRVSNPERGRRSSPAPADQSSLSLHSGSASVAPHIRSVPGGFAGSPSGALGPGTDAWREAKQRERQEHEDRQRRYKAELDEQVCAGSV